MGIQHTPVKDQNRLHGPIKSIPVLNLASSQNSDSDGSILKYPVPSHLFYPLLRPREIPFNWIPQS